jgi:serine/threonine-protein kinase
MSLQGRLLDAKYLLVRPIAEGGMSTVYLGVHQRIGKQVAVKVLNAEVARDPDLVERFECEARIASRIRSAHVPDVYDFGELETGERFMVMEYLEGESFATILERERTIAPQILATIAAQILEALGAAHRAGVVHRDLKPENVIVEPCGKEVLARVIDFGISKIIERPNQKERYAKTTAAGFVLGTPLYMSPEQARGQTSLIDHRTDLYALGVMLYEATAGEPPITGDNVNDLLFRVALDEPEPLSVRVPSVDPMLAAIVRRAMEKNLSSRYQSAEEMLEDVEAWRISSRTHALPPYSWVDDSDEGADVEFVLGGVAASAQPTKDAVESSSVSDAVTPKTPSHEGRRATTRRTTRFRRRRRLAIAVPFIGCVVFFGAPIAQGESDPLASQKPAVQTSAEVGPAEPLPSCAPSRVSKAQLEPPRDGVLRLQQ